MQQRTHGVEERVSDGKVEQILAKEREERLLMLHVINVIPHRRAL